MNTEKSYQKHLPTILATAFLSLLVCSGGEILWVKYPKTAQESAGYIAEWFLPLVVLLALSGLLCAGIELFYLGKERQLLAELRTAAELPPSPWLFESDTQAKGWKWELFRLLRGCTCTATYHRLLLNTPNTGKRHLLYLHHRISELARCSHAATILRLLTQVLLIIGICGTLFGVYNALINGASHLQLAALAPVLQPGAVAIVATIILLFLRHCCQYVLRRFLEELDQLGMERHRAHTTHDRAVMMTLAAQIDGITRAFEALSLTPAATTDLNHLLNSRPPADS